MALSDAAVRQAKATGKDYIFGDSDGLSPKPCRAEHLPCDVRDAA